MINRPSPTPHQTEVLERLRQFIDGPEPCFILKGSAGTGKTTLIANLVELLEGRHRQYALLAPTGRAARILGARTQAPARTIHSEIYALSEIEVFELAESPNDPGMRLHFPLSTRDPGELVLVVDESSMVGDKESKGDLLQFGTGRLLRDLVTYARLGRPGRTDGRAAKIVFVGDPAQLPPVGETQSPALSGDYLRAEFSLASETHELTEVLRQKAGSAILDRATTLRDAIGSMSFTRMDLTSNSPEIVAATVDDAITMAEESLRAEPNSVLITYTNAAARDLNRAIRKRLWNDERAAIQPSDLLLVNKNSAATGLLNGDVIKVINVAPNPERRSVPIKGLDNAVDLAFRRVLLAIPDASGAPIRISCAILENLLDSDQHDLTPVEQRALLVDFRQRNPTLKARTAEFSLAIRQDPYFNALQVKYGYAMTCHKAQGGEWETAIIDFRNQRGQRNAEFFRWTYTAITRARKRLVTVNAPRFDGSMPLWNNLPTEKASPNGSAPPAARQVDDRDWNSFSFAEGQESLFEHHCALRDEWQARGIRIISLSHLQYRERYQLSSGSHICAVDYQYNRKGQRSKFGPAPGTTQDEALLAAALQVLGEAAQSGPNGGTDLHDPFLAAFRDRVLRALAGSDIRLASVRSMQYRLRMAFQSGDHRAEIDFHYDGLPSWTIVEEVGGRGSSRGILAKVQALVQGYAN